MEIHDNEDEEKDALREMCEGEFKMDEKSGRLMEYVAANLKVADFMNCLSEEMWLREVLKDVSSPNAFIRQRALAMWGKYQGFLGSKKERHEPIKEVDFQ
jgi:hypothetical protein